MAPAPTEDHRRSMSFETLRRDVPSNEDVALAEKEQKNALRKPKRNKTRKGKLQPTQSLSSLSDLSIVEIEVPEAHTNGVHHHKLEITPVESVSEATNGVHHLEIPPAESVSFSEVTSGVHHLEIPPVESVNSSEATNGVHHLEIPPVESVHSSEVSNGSLDDTCSSRVEDPPPAVLLSPLLRQRTTALNLESDAGAEQVVAKNVENEAGKPFPGLPTSFDPDSEAHWGEVMSAGNEYSEVDFSPVQHVMDELSDGAALEITTRTGNEQSRERVYNVLFHVPWRCELLIDVGFFVCLDSFLSLLIVTPLRLLMNLPKRLRNMRTVRPNDWCDLCCVLILIAGVKALQQAEISYIYHSIRFEPNIKLYVIYNMLEVFDKLFQSFGVDVLEVLFSSAASCTAQGKRKDFLRLFIDQCIAIGCFIVHSFIIMFEAITLAAALHHAAANRSLLMLLMSNNFAEIKSNVFKRFNKQNMHTLAHNDTVERFHIMTCLVFVFVQNTTAVEGPWMSSFFRLAGSVMLCEILVDLTKHSFLAKFNSVEPAAYTEFLKTLCQQVVDRRRMNASKALHFVPLGPACVLIRVLLPLYVSSGSTWKNSLLFVGTFIILAASKVVVAVLLHKSSAWILNKFRAPEKHSHAD